MGDSAAAAVADVTAAQLAAMTPEAQWLIQHGVPIAILPALEQAMNTRLANERAQLNAQYDAQLAAELAKKAEDDRRLESIAERIGDRLASSVTTALQPLTAQPDPPPSDDEQMSDDHAGPRARKAKIAAPAKSLKGPTARERASAAPVSVRARSVAGTSTASSKAPRSTQIYQMTDKELPAGYHSTKRALQTHIRLLWTGLREGGTPSSPDPANRAIFEAKFRNRSSVMAVNDSSPSLIDPNLVYVPATYPVQPNGRGVSAGHLVGGFMMSMCQTTVSRYGLNAFHPDLSEDAFSAYNSANRLIAISSFQTALTTGSYKWLKADPSLATNVILLVKMYDHYVHYYLKTLFKKEARRPGAVLLDNAKNSSYKHRKRRSDKRVGWLKKPGNAYRNRYYSIAGDTKATSDDEDGVFGGQRVRWLLDKIERSDKANRFARRLEEIILQVEDVEEGTAREIRRVMPPEKKPTKMRKHPKAMFIDYYDPAYYNRLPDSTKAKIAIPLIAFPPDPDHIMCIPPHPDELLSTTELNEKYGADVLKLYNLPAGDAVRSGDEGAGTSEAAGGASWNDDDEEENDDESMGGDDDDEEEADDEAKLEKQRRQWARLFKKRGRV